MGKGLYRLAVWLSFRSIKPAKGKGFFSFASIISVLGVSVGVASLIIVNSVMAGFQSSIKKRLLANNADIIVIKDTPNFYEYSYVKTKLQKMKHVKGVSPFIYIPSMASSSEGSYGISLRGCDPDGEKLITDIPKSIIKGNWDSLKTNNNSIIIGKTLAESLGLTVGDNVTLTIPSVIGEPIAYRFNISAIFDAGMYQFNSGLALVRIDVLSKLSGITQGVTGLMVKLDDPDNVPRVEKEISRMLGKDFIVKDWIEMNRNLFSAMKLEKLAMFFILTLIVAVASLNISSLLMMSVNYKSKDIAILKALGAENGFVLKVFMLQGFAIGLIGTLFGEFFGILITTIGEKYKLISLPADIYYIDHLPFKLNIVDCILAAFVAVVISSLATIYPAMKASHAEPVDILRAGE